MDAIWCFPVGIGSLIRMGGVGLNVVNAFGTLPWATITVALEYHEVPPYLRAIIEPYLRDRTVKFIDQNEIGNRREESYRVPLGSVLGPLLFNLAYVHAVPRTNLLSSVSVI